MQTFLPFADFARTASVLDRQRLGKQRVETLQIMKALTGAASGWANHPAVRMWRGFDCALVRYHEAICDEWTGRGYADTCLDKLLDIHDVACVGHCQSLQDHPVDLFGPSWLDDPDFHRSHRSNLLRKDPIHYGPLFEDGLPSNLEYVWPA